LSDEISIVCNVCDILIRMGIYVTLFIQTSKDIL
jgi:hypothetical protein